MNFLDVFSILYSVFLSSFIIWTTTLRFLEFLDLEFSTEEELLQLFVPEALRVDIQLLLNGYLLNLGQRMPLGHSWKELAQEIHGGSDDKEFLLSIIWDNVKNGTASEWVLVALQILHEWGA